MREQLDRGVGIAMMLQLGLERERLVRKVGGDTFPWLDRAVELPVARLVTEGATYMLTEMSDSNDVLRGLEAQLSPTQRKLLKAAVEFEISSGGWLRINPDPDRTIEGSELLGPQIYARDFPTLGASALIIREKGLIPDSPFYWTGSDMERREEMTQELARYNYRSLRAA